jgi:hypothetical protein
MPLFRKQPAEPDGTLPLTVDGAASLRRLVREAFVAHGREVVVEADHVRDDAGTEYGLWNLAVLCGEEPQRKWPRLVSTHVGNILAPGDIDVLTEEQLVDLVHLKLQPGDGSLDPEAFSVDETVPGAPTVLAVDLPTQVAVPQASYWSERGGAPRWAEVGRRNLAAVVGAPDIEHHRVQQGETEFSVLLGESFFTASLALVLDDVVAHYDGSADLSRGLLVAMPNRHQLVWRAVDGPTVLTSLSGMVAFTVMGYDEGAGPVSREVYWRHLGRWEQLTALHGDEAVVHVGPELQAVLEELG